MQRNVNLIVSYCFFVMFLLPLQVFLVASAGGKLYFVMRKFFPWGEESTHFIKFIETYDLISSKTYSHKLQAKYFQNGGLDLF